MAHYRVTLPKEEDGYVISLRISDKGIFPALHPHTPNREFSQAEIQRAKNIARYASAILRGGTHA